MFNLRAPGIAAAALIILSMGSAWGDSGPAHLDIFCSSLLQSNSTFSNENYSKYFDPTFTSRVSLEDLKSIFAGVLADTGRCVSYSSSSQGKPGIYSLTLKTEKAFEVSLILVVDPTSNLFSGVSLTGVDNPRVAIKSWDDVGLALKGLDADGLTGATLKTADGRLHLTQNSSVPFAIGSTFKLYILGALYNSVFTGQHTWSETLVIQDDWKSLPSGTMQNLAPGTKVSFKDLATNMISISDNTAADHLLYSLGRHFVESMLTPMNNSHAILNIPFMSTSEMFKLKWAIDPSETLNYINSNPSEKLETLKKLKQVPISNVGKNGVSLDRPTNISTLEWFASTDDNCEAMLWLGNKNSQDLKQILAKSVPLIDTSASSHWSYAGYKGGSEPGVISMTFLLESKIGNRACLSMTWNNNSKPVSNYLLLDVVKKTLIFAESQVP